jgi:hypothetical protein
LIGSRKIKQQYFGRRLRGYSKVWLLGNRSAVALL